MELRHLRYFVAVAEELNFTRAAEKLGINQPPLSLQVRQLEKEMGTQLFHRRTRGVELTDAGKLLLEEARVILKQVERAKTGVRRRGRGETGRLIVGSAGATYFHPLIPAIIREYGLTYPDIILAPQASNTALLMAQLCAARIDVGIIRPPITGGDNVSTMPLVNEKTLVVVPSGHALSGSKSVQLAALAKEKFVLTPRALNPGNYDSIMAACHRAGFTPVIGQEAPQIVSVIPLVAGGLGVSIVPWSMSRILIDGITYLDIDGDSPRAEICLAFRRDENSPAVRNFVAVARRLAQPTLKGKSS